LHGPVLSAAPLGEAKELGDVTEAVALGRSCHDLQIGSSEDARYQDIISRISKAIFRLADKALTKRVTITHNDIQSRVRCTPIATKRQTQSCVGRDEFETRSPEALC